MGYPGTNPSALAWTRVCRAAVDLAAAWAEFKLALDDYALITRGGQLPFGDSNQDRTPDESDPASEPVVGGDGRTPIIDAVTGQQIHTPPGAK